MHEASNFKPCLTKQFLNVFKLCCEWGILYLDVKGAASRYFHIFSRAGKWCLCISTEFDLIPTVTGERSLKSFHLNFTSIFIFRSALVASQWLGLFLQFIGVAMVTAVAFIAVLEHHFSTVDPGEFLCLLLLLLFSHAK